MAVPNGGDFDEIKAKFSHLRKRVQALGLEREEILKLKPVQKYRPKEKSLSRLLCVGLFLFVALSFLIGSTVFLLLHFEIFDQEKAAQLVANHITNVDLQSDRCLVPLPESYVDVFRPPTDCGFCHNVSEVARVADLQPNDFVEKYAYSGRPVIITDATKNWTASDHFSFKFFRKIYKKGSPVLTGEGDGCQFFGYKTNFHTLKEVFRMPKEDAEMKGKPWYVGWSNCDANAADVLRKFYQRPYFFPPELESSKTDWIFMGTPGYGAHMHIDNVQQSSWQAQIKGRKRWTIVPPPECYYECPSGQIEAVVNPGEVIILDTNRWFHQTDIIGQDMSITIGSEYD